MRQWGIARLRIVHVVRAPIGGIFRHIVDLATAQADAGHEVGIVCNSLEGGAFEADAIAAVAPRLALGATRVPMRRQISLSDMRATRALFRHLVALAPDVVHGHGAKGGTYGRLIGTWLGRKRPIARVYSPHGGSLHYSETSTEGRFYFAAERLLERATDALVHVSTYEAETYRRKVGVPRRRAVVIHNGLRAEEYRPVVPAPDARDLLFLGMIRDLKGIDVFLEALALLQTKYGRAVTAHVVGQTEDVTPWRDLAHSLGIADRVAFHAPKPTREAFAMARALVVPSRAEFDALCGAGSDRRRPAPGGDAGGRHSRNLRAARGRPGAARRPGCARGCDRRAPGRPRARRTRRPARRDWLMPRFNIGLMQDQVGTLYDDILAGKHARRGTRAPADVIRTRA